MRQSRSPAPGFVGSQSCRECHEKFYQLWSTSFHGLAMQPYTSELARTNLTEQKTEIVAGKYRFLADLRKSVVLERTAAGEKSYPIVQVMGGKNVYYFLTPLERGWLQVLPVAYDVRRREWFDTTASAMRHFGDRAGRGALLEGAAADVQHVVLQLPRQPAFQELRSASPTATTPPGRSRGSTARPVTGPSGGHVTLFRELPANQPAPEDIKLIVLTKLTAEQRNATCAPCHAKMSPVTHELRSR